MKSNIINKYFSDTKVLYLMKREIREAYAQRGAKIFFVIVLLVPFLLSIIIPRLYINDSNQKIVNVVYGTVVRFIIPIGVSMLGIFAGSSINQELKSGSMNQLLVSPMRRWEIAVSKMLPTSLLSLAFVFTTLTGALIGGIKISPESFISILLISFLVGIAMSALGTVIALLVLNEKIFNGIFGFFIAISLNVSFGSGLRSLWSFNPDLAVLDIFPLLMPITPLMGMISSAFQIKEEYVKGEIDNRLFNDQLVFDDGVSIAFAILWFIIGIYCVTKIFSKISKWERY